MPQRRSATALRRVTEGESTVVIALLAKRDVLPKGREEYGPNHSLPDWAKVHDQYGNDGKGEPAGGCVSH
jgi:predicted dithiol-disulfide oxidoreductase (DUF899 family)